VLLGDEKGEVSAVHIRLLCWAGPAVSLVRLLVAAPFMHPLTKSVCCIISVSLSKYSWSSSLPTSRVEPVPALVHCLHLLVRGSLEKH
jgi:hypothetical protein